MDKYKVLVVDDDSEILKTVHNILKDTYRTILVKSGQEAIQYLENYAVDLILSDIDMLEMSGYDLIQRVKQNNKLSAIPVMFLTGHTDLDHEVKGISMGAVDYVHKPIQARILMARIARHIGKESERTVCMSFEKDSNLLFTKCDDFYAKYLGFDSGDSVVGTLGEPILFSAHMRVDVKAEQEVLSGIERTILSQWYDSDMEEIKMLEIKMVPKENEEGQIVGIFGEVYLVESQRQLKEKIVSIHEKNSGLIRIIENAGLIIMNFMINGTCYFVNENICKIGYLPNDLLGKKVSSFGMLEAEDLTKYKMMIQAAIQSQESDLTDNVQLITPDGRINARINMHIVYVSEGKPLNIEVVIIPN